MRRRTRAIVKKRKHLGEAKRKKKRLGKKARRKRGISKHEQ